MQEHLTKCRYAFSRVANYELGQMYHKGFTFPIDDLIHMNWEKKTAKWQSQTKSADSPYIVACPIQLNLIEEKA